MKKKIKTIGSISIIIIAGLALITPAQANDSEIECVIINSPPWGPPTTVYVDDDNTEGPWDGTEEHPFQKIQDAIDNAPSCQYYNSLSVWWYPTIIVKNGTYTEDILINKTLNLKGEDKENTIINGSGSSNTVKITAEGVTIRGFTIQNGGIVHPGAGIYILANYTKITDNLIQNNYEGIYLKNFSSNCTIDNNIIYGRVTLDKANYNIISNNYITATSEGIQFSKSHHNKIFKNTIENCNVYNNPNLRGVTLWSSNSNIFYLNNFINNKNGNAKEENKQNKWDNGVHGNYWDDYNGVDSNNDGIGDISYPIDELDNQDNHPLMKPYEEYSFSVKINCENSFKQIFPGQTISFEIDITNTGDIIDKYNIKSYLWDTPEIESEYTIPDIFVSFNVDNVTLRSDETKTIFANATVLPQSSGILECNIWVVSQTDKSVKEKTKIYLNVKSVKVDLSINSGFSSPQISIKNIGAATLSRINYTVSIKGFRRHSINITHKDSLDVLYVGTEKIVTIPRGMLKATFGFVTVKIYLKESILGRNPLEKEYTFTGFCFGRYIKIFSNNFLS